MERTGRCLCGACTFTAEPYGTSQACHCEQCRVWGGGPYMAVPCKTASFDGPVQRYQSSDFAERGFCKTCGTHLFFHLLGGERHGVPLGIFDDQTGLPFKAEIFIDEKPDFYAFEGARKCMTGAEFEEKFR